jgi:hypothetical protein
MTGLHMAIATRALFLFRVLYLYNIFPFYLLLVRLWTMDKPQDHWEQHCAWVCGLKLQQHEASVPMASNVMIASNHRNITDYFVQHCICKHSTNTLSRAGVGLAFPLAYLITTFLGTVWYFRRGNTREHIEE